MKAKEKYILSSGLFSSIFLLLFLGSSNAVFSQTTETFTSDGTFTVPAGVTSITVECWGAGGGGATITGNAGGGGGGGGAYSIGVLTVTPDGTHNIIVGQGGVAGNDGGNSSFGATLVVGVGGKGAVQNSQTGGSGGNSADSTGDTSYSGGNGGSVASGKLGAGGGGGAGSTGAGGNGATPTVQDGGTGTPLNGGNGGDGGANSNGLAGSTYGGGGGGAGKANSGGSGADGYVTVTYTAAASDCPESTAVAPSATQTLCQGDSSNQLTATVTTSGGSGSPTLLYQWYYNTTNSNTVSGATLIGGATNSTFTPLTTVSEVGDRWYFNVGYATDNGCGQTNADQALASNAVQVTVSGTPTTAAAGSPQTICVDGGGTTLGANTPTVGTGAWSVVSGPSTSNAQFSSIADPSATFTPSGGAGSYVLRWTISNAPCTPSTSDVTITVNAEPTISNAGGPQTICDGDPATLTANSPSVGTGTWSVQSGPNTSTAQFSSISDPAATFTPTGGVGDYVLRWTISNDPCTPSTSDLTITVIETPATPGAITGPTTATPNTSGLVYSISAVTYATTYNWNVPSGWSITAGLGTTSITVTSGNAGENGNITVTAQNSCGTSAASTLAVTSENIDCPISTSVTPPDSQNLCSGDSSTQLTASVITSGGTGTPTVLYQWYYNTSNSNTIAGATSLAGATSQTYTPLTGIPEIGIRYYFSVGYATDNGCEQTNATQSLASNTVVITVEPPTPATPGAISGPTTATPNTGGLVYSISAVTYATSYNWTVPTGWSITAGGTTSITVTSGNEGQNGNITITAQNSCGTSSASTLAVTSENINCPNSTSVTPLAIQTICQDDPSNELSASVTTSGGSGTPTIQYQWYYNTANSNTVTGAALIGGATSQAYTPLTTASEIGSRWYFCVGYATDNSCSQTNTDQALASNAVEVTVEPPAPATPGAISGPTTATPNTSGLVYSISAVTYATTYNWSVPVGWSIDSGNGTTSISVTSGSAGNNGNITVTAQNSCGTSDPSALAVTSEIAGSPPTITLGSIPAICSGTTSANLPYSATTDSPDRYYINFDATAESAGFVDVVDALLPSSPISITVPGAISAGTYTGYLKVTNSSTGLSSSNYVIQITVIDTPSTPIISGQTNVPENSDGFTYSIAPVSNATYNWNVPNGWNITDGGTTNRITVTTGALGQGGDITVTVTNPCGTSNQGSLTVSVSDATDHTLYNCTSCHITHNAPGSGLTNVAGNALLCQSCHTSTGAASAKPLVNGDNGVSSHAWDVLAVNATKETNLPNDSQMVLRIVDNKIICSTCHDQHNSSIASPHLRMDNTGDALCKDCHSARDVGLYSTDNVNNKGSHPVGINYDGGDSRFNTSPTNTQLVSGNVECSSCHGVHDVTGTLGLAANGNLLRATNDASLCTDCHNYESHQGMDCLDCHQIHNTDKANIYMIRNSIATPNSGTKTVSFTTLTGTNSFADGDATYDGICEVCHTGTSYFRNDGSASDQNHSAQGGPMNGQNCTICHPHSAKFAPSGGGCTECHEAETPTYTSTVHVKHNETYGFACSTCHFNYGSGGSLEGTHPSETININFDPNGLATRNGADGNTPSWSSGTKTCSNIYCHSDGRSAYRGTDGTYTWSGTIGSQSATYDTPDWDIALLQSAIETEISEQAEISIQTIRVELDAQIAGRELIIPEFDDHDLWHFSEPVSSKASLPNDESTIRTENNARKPDEKRYNDCSVSIAGDSILQPVAAAPETFDVEPESVVEKVLNKTHTGPGDLKSLRGRAWTLAARLAQRNGMPDLVEPISGKGLGFILRDVPDPALADQLDNESLSQVSMVWWHLAASSEMTVAPVDSITPSLPADSVLRRALEQQDAGLLFNSVWTLDPGHTGYQLWRSSGEQDWADLLRLMDNYRRIHRLAEKSDIRLWE